MPATTIAKRTAKETTASRTLRMQTIRDLSDLITALDRRTSRVERIGEAAIARAAAKLRDEAILRIADLDRDDLR